MPVYKILAKRTANESVRIIVKAPDEAAARTSLAGVIGQIGREEFSIDLDQISIEEIDDNTPADFTVEAG